MASPNIKDALVNLTELLGLIVDPPDPQNHPNEYGLQLPWFGDPGGQSLKALYETSDPHLPGLIHALLPAQSADGKKEVFAAALNGQPASGESWKPVLSNSMAALGAVW